MLALVFGCVSRQAGRQSSAAAAVALVWGQRQVQAISSVWCVGATVLVPSSVLLVLLVLILLALGVALLYVYVCGFGCGCAVHAQKVDTATRDRLTVIQKSTVPSIRSCHSTRRQQQTSPSTLTQPKATQQTQHRKHVPCTDTGLQTLQQLKEHPARVLPQCGSTHAHQQLHPNKDTPHNSQAGGPSPTAYKSPCLRVAQAVCTRSPLGATST